MTFAKKVAVAVELDDSVDRVFDQLKSMSFLDTSEIHLVHVVHTINYSFGISGVPLIYPIDKDREEIRSMVLQKLRDHSKELKGHIFVHCLFAENQKKEFADFVTTEKADLAIVATRLKHGFLESSFAQYVNRHTDVSLLMLKK